MDVFRGQIPDSSLAWREFHFFFFAKGRGWGACVNNKHNFHLFHSVAVGLILPALSLSNT